MADITMNPNSVDRIVNVMQVWKIWVLPFFGCGQMKCGTILMGWYRKYLRFLKSFHTPLLSPLPAGERAIKKHLFRIEQAL